MEKLYISTKEGDWNEKIPASITENESSILNSEDLTLKNDKFILLNNIKERTNIPVEDNLADILSHYNNVKMSLNIKNNDTYKLISISMLVNDNIVSGILNYSINNEHKQFRF